MDYEGREGRREYNTTMLGEKMTFLKLTTVANDQTFAMYTAKSTCINAVLLMGKYKWPYDPSCPVDFIY